MTPLVWALSCENRVGVTALLDEGADPNLSLPSGSTPTILAAHMEDAGLLSALLASGGDADARVQGASDTALRAAFSLGAEGRGWANFNALLNAGADINVEHSGETIAEFAALLNHFDKVADLLNRGYDHNLDRLGFFVQAAPLDVIDQEEVEWHARVQIMLRQRGVVFPVSRQDAGFPDVRYEHRP